jgi:hypothetical protein
VVLQYSRTHIVYACWNCNGSVGQCHCTLVHQVSWESQGNCSSCYISFCANTSQYRMSASSYSPQLSDSQGPAQGQEEGSVGLVAGKSNPMVRNRRMCNRELNPFQKGILDASSVTWRQRLEDEHQIGACPLHKTSRCVQRDGLHFILTFPMLNAWACYLVSHTLVTFACADDTSVQIHKLV